MLKTALHISSGKPASGKPVSSKPVSGKHISDKLYRTRILSASLKGDDIYSSSSVGTLMLALVATIALLASPVSSAEEQAPPAQPKLAKSSPKFPTAPVVSDSGKSSASDSDTLFIRTRLSEGAIESKDLRGRNWKYDHDLELFRLNWIGSQSPNISRNDVVYFNDDDTVIVGLDRSRRWARTLRKVSRSHHGKLDIEEEEYVIRIIRCAGKVTVAGLVEGDIYSDKEIIVTRTGIINGDAIAPKIRVRSGGLVTGEENTVSAAFNFGSETDDEYGAIIDFGAFSVIAGLGGLLLLIAFLSLSVAPKAVSMASETISRHLPRTLGVGFLSLILFGPVIGLLAITIIGIPVALLLVFAMPVALLVGVVAFSQFIGSVVMEAYGKQGWSPQKEITVGTSIIIGLWIVAVTLLTSGSNFLSDWGGILLAITIVYSSIALVTGIGGVTLTRFGRRFYNPPGDTGSQYPPPPTPPPLPKNSVVQPPPTLPPPPSPPPISQNPA